MGKKQIQYGVMDLVRRESAAGSEPALNRPYKGYVVIEQEVKELQVALKDMEQCLKAVYKAGAKRDNQLGRMELNLLEGSSIKVATQAVQIAAMAREYRHNVMENEELDRTCQKDQAAREKETVPDKPESDQ